MREMLGVLVMQVGGVNKLEQRWKDGVGLMRGRRGGETRGAGSGGLQGWYDAAGGGGRERVEDFRRLIRRVMVGGWCVGLGFRDKLKDNSLFSTSTPMQRVQLRERGLIPPEGLFNEESPETY